MSLWRLIKTHWLLCIALGLYGWATLAAPERVAEAAVISVRTFVSVLPLVAAVMGLVGLLQVWVSRDLVVGLLGEKSGVKGLLIAAACGTLLIGPAYIIFPLLMSIRRQGARWAVIVIVLTAYAVKLQMIPLEVEYLGWRFSLARTCLTLLFAVPLGLLVERLLTSSPDPSRS